ncbi:hypothetical protein [Streptococcus mutans]|uniref:hypothetical protein n=1 Tax=Streptococcus mutans TaxID=1309 RepID=UPI0028E516DE|nr:hypothetical protein [Streptococcus mutans]MDT9516102.1 hypothetical protein [Streptococcus mutans]MDT9518204.1 hypothetical protein [Streptococcus mutans]
MRFKKLLVLGSLFAVLFGLSYSVVLAEGESSSSVNSSQVSSSNQSSNNEKLGEQSTTSQSSSEEKSGESTKTEASSDSKQKETNDNSKKSKTKSESKEKKAKTVGEAIKNAIKKAAFDKVNYSEIRDHLDGITSMAYFGNDWAGMSSETNYFINKLVQATFWPAKIVFKVCAVIYDFTANAGKDSVDNYISTIISNSATLFNALLSGDMLTLIGGLMLVYAYARFAAGGSFFASLFKSIMVYLLALTFFMRVGPGNQYVVQIAYNTTSEVVNGMTDSLTKARTGYTATDNVLDQYAIQTIWKPFVYMNAEVEKVADDGEVTSKQVTTDDMKDLVGYEPGNNDDYPIGDKKISDFVGSGDDVHIPMMKDAWGAKFSYAAGGTLDAVMMGFAIVLLGVVSFVLKVLFLILLMLSPFILAISLIPTFENILFNFAKNLFGAIALSLFVSFFATLFLYFYSTLTTIISAMFSSNYFVQTCFKSLVLFVLWRKREFLISRLTASGHSGFMDGLGGRIRGLKFRTPRVFRRTTELAAGVTGGYLVSKALNRLRGGRKVVAGSVKHTAGLGINHIKDTVKRRMSDLLAHYSGIRSEQKNGDDPFAYGAGYTRSKARQARAKESIDRFRSNMDSYRHKVQGNILKYAGQGMSKRNGDYDYYAAKANEHLERAKAKYKPKFQENVNEKKK